MPRGTVALLGLLVAFDACAQVSGSMTLVSDYRFRGDSLSDEKPAAQISVAYDHPSGWYAGAFGSTIRLANQSGRNLQMLSYAGYVRRTRSGVSWEVGADYSAFSGAGHYDYAEIYAGIASDHVSGRIYYASNYFRQSSGTAYAELNGAHRLRDRLHLLGHLGVLCRNSRSTTAEGSGCYRFDARVGVGIDLDSTSIQLTWVATHTTDTVYSVDASRDRSALVLSLSRPF